MAKHTPCKKYYVTDFMAEKDGVKEGTRFLTLAPTPALACAYALHFEFKTAMINGFYKVSEIGHEEHESDKLVDSDLANELYIKLCENQFFPNNSN
jgi:hypothetical protein